VEEYLVQVVRIPAQQQIVIQVELLQQVETAFLGLGLEVLAHHQLVMLQVAHGMTLML
jgi:hypothetical protein